ncbi:MAG: serine hydrolase [Verrucomicrobia bacterium]|nr:serine hydrolase [Verrucomicrobiota bacterium]
MNTLPCSPNRPVATVQSFAGRFVTPIRGWLALAALASLLEVGAEARAAESASPSRSPRLQSLVDQAVRKTFEKFAEKNLQADQLAVTLVDLRDSTRPTQASYRGHVQIYPASVVKLFYMAAVHRWLEDGRIQETDEVRRALRDMIVDSGNEPTHYLVDLLTGTTSGPELAADELEAWLHQRNAVNRYFASLGYTNINVNRKPWCEGPYGREMQSVKLHAPNHRNWLTTDATARLLTEIATGKAISGQRSAEMMKLLARSPFAADKKTDSQARDFTGIALAPGDKLWSKAGWTSETRHDAAYVEPARGPKFALVTFTTGHATEREIIPFVAKMIIESLTATE